MLKKEELLEVINYSYIDLKNEYDKVSYKIEEIRKNTNEFNLNYEDATKSDLSKNDVYIRLCLKITELKLLLNEYSDYYHKVEDSINNNTNLDVDNKIFEIINRNYLDKEGKIKKDITSIDSKEKFKSNIEYIISNNTNKFKKSMNELEFYNLDEYVDYIDSYVDVDSIMKEIEEIQDDLSKENLIDLKDAVVYICNLVARKKNASNIKIANDLSNFSINNEYGSSRI